MLDESKVAQVTRHLHGFKLPRPARVTEPEWEVLSPMQQLVAIRVHGFSAQVKECKAFFEIAKRFGTWREWIVYLFPDSHPLRKNLEARLDYKQRS